MAVRKSNVKAPSKTVSDKGASRRRPVPPTRTTTRSKPLTEDYFSGDANVFNVDPIVLKEGVGSDIVVAPENHPVVEYLRSKKIADSLSPYNRAAVYGVVEYIYRDAVPTIKTPAEAKDFSTILLALYKILLISKDAQIAAYLLDLVRGNTTAMSTADVLQKELVALRQKTLQENIKLVDSISNGTALGVAIFDMIEIASLDNVRESVPRLCSEILDVKAVSQLITSITKIVLD